MGKIFFRIETNPTASPFSPSQTARTIVYNFNFTVFENPYEINIETDIQVDEKEERFIRVLSMKNPLQKVLSASISCE